MPTQSWLSIGDSPEGDIFITGSDHKTNSALYRFSASDQTLRYVGDAKSASEAVENWAPGETAEKFHVRPTYFRGKVYLATADFTESDDRYLQRRGFHWYSYDLTSQEFSDLSKDEPGGIGGEHASIVALAKDEESGYIYGIDTPCGLIFRYDVDHRKTTNLGKSPRCLKGYQMPGRYMWIGKDRRLYFTVSTVDHVLFYDPRSGWGEKKDWKLDTINGASKVFRTGAESPDRQSVFLADVDGRIFCYRRGEDSFKQIGQLLESNPMSASGRSLKARAFNVSRDGKRIYFINDDAGPAAFWEWVIAGNTTRQLCLLSDLDPRLDSSALTTHGGNESWDRSGRVFFCAFGNDLDHPTQLFLCCLDPEKLRDSVRQRDAGKSRRTVGP